MSKAKPKTQATTTAQATTTTTATVEPKAIKAKVSKAKASTNAATTTQATAATKETGIESKRDKGSGGGKGGLGKVGETSTGPCAASSATEENGGGKGGKGLDKGGSGENIRDFEVGEQAILTKAAFKDTADKKSARKYIRRLREIWDEENPSTSLEEANEPAFQKMRDWANYQRANPT